jgi:thioredoxin-related protein
MRKTISAAIFLVLIKTAGAQEAKLYNPAANAEKDIAEAVAKAKAENKFVLIQAGGNWCSWCIKFAKFCTDNKDIDSFLNKNFVVYHLNHSPENKNEALFKKYGYPQRFGFPVFLILDSTGTRIHTQNSEYLENGKGSYEKIKVQMFFEMWSPWGLNPKMYGD